MPVFRFVKQVFQEFSRDKAGQLSAAFAYVAVFSIGPLLLVLISVAGLVFGEQAAKGELFSHLSSAVGPSTAKALQNAVAHTHQSGGGGVALAAGIIGMLLGAAGLTTQLQNSFNAIFNVVPDPRGGWKRLIYVKLKNILLVIVAGLAVVASVVASTLVNGLGDKARQYLNLPPPALELLNNLLSLLVFVLILYLIYRVLPDVRIPSKIVLAASTVVALLFIIGKVVLAVVIGRNGAASAYGAAASLVTLLLWVYYSGQILFIGAEGMKVYAFGHAVSYPPKKFNLKRHTIHVDNARLADKLLDAASRGFKKGQAKNRARKK
jgi:membrane protein